MSMKDLLSIKEFSKLSGIESSTLRYWDDIGVFSPAIRDPQNNYRYYLPLQLITVNFITVLSNLNVPLKTIGEVENDRTPEKIMRLIDQQEMLLDMEMSKLRESYSIIHARRDLINYGMAVNVAEISVSCKEEQAFILGPPTKFKKNGGFYEPFADFINHAEELRINLNFPIGGYFQNMDAFLGRPGEPDYFFSLDPTGNRKRTAGDYLVGFNRGYYGDMGNTPEKMASYAKENSLTLSGPVYCLYLLDEICIKEPSQYLAQICVAVSKAGFARE